MATMKRVAARAKVSISTVSRVVNQSGYVASSVRENVLKAVKELGYQPSAIARGLRAVIFTERLFKAYAPYARRRSDPARSWVWYVVPWEDVLASD
jgi:DNA-binding LacI/PurR family transcriptional regulator